MIEHYHHHLVVIILLPLLVVSSGIVYGQQQQPGLRVLVTFVENGDETLDKWTDVDIYIQEHPQFERGTIDLHDALWNDSPYTGQWTAELEIPSDVIEEGQTFHVCLQEDGTSGEILFIECFQLENGQESEPEELTVYV
jgi:hypothetical protein